MTTYIRVSEEEGSEGIEIPVEDDGTLFLSTLAAQFPGACGLKYRNPENKALRGVKFVEERLICPDEGWVYDFFCTFPKSDGKRKSSDILESSNSAKSKRLDILDKCTDLIVLDLAWTTTEKELKDYFAKFGNVVMAQLKMDPTTGKSRGYGFVRFDDLEVQKQVLGMRHTIGRRTCDVRVPKSKDPHNPYLSSKIFVGRILENFTDIDIRDHFSQFGDVTYVFIPKKPFRAFAFVQFIEPRAAKEACEHQEHLINGVAVSVSTANERKDPSKASGNFNSPDESDWGSDAGAPAIGGGYGGSRGAQGFRGGDMKRRGGGGGRNDGFNGNGERMNMHEQGGWNSRGGGGIDSSGMNFNALAADVVAAITQQLGVMGPPPQGPPPPGPPHHRRY